MVQGDNSRITAGHLTQCGSSNLSPAGRYMTQGESSGSHAYMVQGEGSSMNAPGNLFTQDQFQQILAFLNRVGIDNTNTNTDASTSSGPIVVGGNALKADLVKKPKRRQTKMEVRNG
ncbi:hypothetical protein K7X08_031072 [Anisodus acutangulus]|uniref:Uncharacterized protein n=1 Tax=Anisodus acutangulus TaxID=402998 RepID=A0A9Q1MKG7_9SOLA|nr:hypothetical protein K7X08_031072 [Anisodus acutangulus]